MHFSAAVAAFLPILAVSAADIKILVGDGGLTFNPSSAQAKNGDVVAFEFRAKNHSVTQSTFANPCAIMTTPNAGIDSGFQAVAAGATSFPQWSFTVQNETAPLWFFCAQPNHCKQGMVFALNPTADKTFDKYLENAKAATDSSSGSASASASSVSSAASGSVSTAALPTLSSSPATSATTTGSAGASSATPSNGAVRTSGRAASILTFVGVIAGLTL
jgi:plastocyanin